MEPRHHMRSWSEVWRLRRIAAAAATDIAAGRLYVERRVWAACGGDPTLTQRVMDIAARLAGYGVLLTPCDECGEVGYHRIECPGNAVESDVVPSEVGLRAWR